MTQRIQVLLLMMAIAAGTVTAQSPQILEAEILGLLETIAKTGTYSGNFDPTASDNANKQLKDKLLVEGRHLSVLEYPFAGLAKEMFVATSNDGKLRIYSWDEQTGGTMRDHSSVFQYQGKRGKVFTWAEDNDDESAGSFYSEVFQLDTRRGSIYLATSTSIGSTSMHGQSIQAMRIDGDQLDLNAKLIRTSKGLTDSISFGYDFFSVVERPERPVKLFEFDERKKEFRFPIVIEDEVTRQGRVTDRFITYRFDGRYFVKLN